MVEKYLKAGTYLVIPDAHLKEWWDFQFEEAFLKSLKQAKGQGQFRGIILLGDFINAKCDYNKVMTANLKVFKILMKENMKDRVFWVKGNNDSKFGKYDRLIGFHCGTRFAFIHGHQFDWYRKFDGFLNLFKSKNKLRKASKKSKEWKLRKVEKVEKIGKKIDTKFVVGHYHFNYSTMYTHFIFEPEIFKINGDF